MKRLEIAISGTHEAEVGNVILAGVYSLLQNYGYMDVSIKSDTVSDPPQKELQLFGFMQPADGRR